MNGSHRRHRSKTVVENGLKWVDSNGGVWGTFMALPTIRQDAQAVR